MFLFQSCGLKMYLVTQHDVSGHGISLHERGGFLHVCIHGHTCRHKLLYIRRPQVSYYISCSSRCLSWNHTIPIMHMINKLTPSGISSYNSFDLKHDQCRSCVHIIPGYLENLFCFFFCPGCKLSS